ncbi:MAG: adenylyltransferase/cytidyltransferase family protein [Dehalococcoidales bacterium]
MVKVAVAGGWDPIHIGHLRHFQKARKLGDYLIVFVSTDKDMIRKKGYCFMPLEDRMGILREFRCVDEVIATIDKDGTQAKTLRMVRPNIFAKGGDRTPDNMPANEIETCKEIGCEIVYGVGKQLNSSSKLVKKSVKKMLDVNKVNQE